MTYILTKHFCSRGAARPPHQNSSRKAASGISKKQIYISASASFHNSLFYPWSVSTRLMRKNSSFLLRPLMQRPLCFHLLGIPSCWRERLIKGWFNWKFTACGPHRNNETSCAHAIPEGIQKNGDSFVSPCAQSYIALGDNSTQNNIPAALNLYTYMYWVLRSQPAAAA